MRRLTNRLRHLPTVALVSFSRWAIDRFASPSALLRTMRARLLKAAGSERLRANDTNSRSTTPNQPLACQFSLRYLRSKDTAMACTINASYLWDRTLALDGPKGAFHLGSYACLELIQLLDKRLLSRTVFSALLLRDIKATCQSGSWPLV